MILLILSGCAPVPASPNLEDATLTPALSAAAETESVPEASVAGDCGLEPLVVPTRPAVIPRYAQLDPDTGLHVTGTAQDIDPVAYRLKVNGLVDHPLELTLDQIRCMQMISAEVDLICPGYFEDRATFAGARLKDILEMAGVQPEATRVKLISADGFPSYVNLSDAMDEDNFLAYEWEGEPLPILHGFPLRAVFPGTYGSHWIKWLVEIQVE